MVHKAFSPSEIGGDLLNSKALLLHTCEGFSLIHSPKELSLNVLMQRHLDSLCCRDPLNDINRNLVGQRRRVGLLELVHSCQTSLAGNDLSGAFLAFNANQRAQEPQGIDRCS
uniref:Uncharacterized protein n=1 Tax=uncultured marine virus TaxID=186617 RepID=A0A0F7L8B9_9VIRU|nr:hypothetical protein [uncultured marine virus]